MNGDLCDTTSGKVQIPVPHTVQKHSWDCGLACAVSVLKFLGKDTDEIYSRDLATMGCGESVWTIDLAHLMALHSVRHMFCTTLLGVDKSYSTKSFYSRHFTEDERRINQLFEVASNHGICFEQRSVSTEDIFKHLLSSNLLIVLVDWEHLECVWCDMKICPSLNCFKCCGGSYQGHFIVVCGFDRDHGHIYYKNPSYRKELCCSRIDKFETARRSHGTDEDILFVYQETNCQDSPLEKASNSHNPIDISAE
ncbi:protein GUCD1-like [Liolophura sinensis]|uniref:protein GUCD1-like n=1 Tax=Liolophura sinensis TaxID=3198878 RepID=UPI0031593A5B